MPNTTQARSVNIRMYRAGTGDFFILKFNNGYKMMIDCGCIQGGENDFKPLLKNLKEYTDSEIDLLVVTHEHADHINGFKVAAQYFKGITVKKLWLAWTEDKNDSFANDLRANHTEIKLALRKAGLKLQSLQDSDYYQGFFAGDFREKEKIENQNNFAATVKELTELNLFGADEQNIPTIEDILRDNEIINDKTKVEFFSPGELYSNIENLTGVRFFVLGPPRDNEALKLEHKTGQGYDKRKEKSQVNMSFVDALINSQNIISNPFDSLYFETGFTNTSELYKAPENLWRQIEHDWLYSAGALAMRHESSINNTSLALAIQFIDSGKVLLFPGDAEYGNWESWKEIIWKIETGKVGIQYLLNNTVFYKVGHHMSHNGSGKELGIEMMISEDLTAMATLDFKKIMPRWLNTMPNDIIGETLINKTQGRLYFLGSAKEILHNIQTDRTSIKSTHIDTFLNLNKEFDGINYIDYEVK